MVSVKRNYNSVIFEVKGWDKVFAFKSSLEIPVEHIVAVYAAPDIEMKFFRQHKTFRHFNSKSIQSRYILSAQ